ncbi:Protein bicaudal C -like protein 1-B [Sarcoptes scabiei]|uniref:Protein bicaudal C -like protein 1-B n=1 Tax=Sarcoptes scabiei TaxID=52283 RepID=A0A834R359_SARSC|nr:Protein bicaudal C -like protein 1-B [Sarcoptes scabiei]
MESRIYSELTNDQASSIASTSSPSSSSSSSFLSSSPLSVLPNKSTINSKATKIESNQSVTESVIASISPKSSSSASSSASSLASSSSSSRTINLLPINPIISNCIIDTLESNSSSNEIEFYYEKDLKVDKKILAIMSLGGNEIHPSLDKFIAKITSEAPVKVNVSNSLRDRQGNEIPVLKVKSLDQKSLEIASALIMERLDPHRDKMTFNIDVPYNDHSYIIGKDGTRIKQLSRMTGCHIHLPDCNKTSSKKSNKLSIAGTDFTAIDKARDQIRKSLPLNIGFKAQIKSGKFVIIDTASSEVQAVKRKYRVDVTFTNVIANTKYPEVTINVKGGRSQLEEIEAATQELYHFVTEEKLCNNPNVIFAITIDVSHSHHQYVKGKNNCNLKVINQRSGALIAFPPSDSGSNQVIIQSKNLLSTVMGWQELMGYLPLLLSFDVNFDINNHFSKLQKLEKEFGVGIRTREKLSGHVYTLLIKTQERHSTYLQEIRQRILNFKHQALNENLNSYNHNQHFSSFHFQNNLHHQPGQQTHHNPKLNHYHHHHHHHHHLSGPNSSLTSSTFLNDHLNGHSNHHQHQQHPQPVANQMLNQSQRYSQQQHNFDQDNIHQNSNINHQCHAGSQLQKNIQKNCIDSLISSSTNAYGLLNFSCYQNFNPNVLQPIIENLNGINLNTKTFSSAIKSSPSKTQNNLEPQRDLNPFRQQKFQQSKHNHPPYYFHQDCNACKNNRLNVFTTDLLVDVNNQIAQSNNLMTTNKSNSMSTSLTSAKNLTDQLLYNPFNFRENIESLSSSIFNPNDVLGNQDNHFETTSLNNNFKNLIKNNSKSSTSLDDSLNLNGTANETIASSSSRSSSIRWPINSTNQNINQIPENSSNNYYYNEQNENDYFLQLQSQCFKCHFDETLMSPAMKTYSNLFKY